MAHPFSDTLRRYSRADGSSVSIPGTDKLTTHAYGDVYDAVCGRYAAAERPAFLEIGVQTGAFVHALAAHYPRAQVYGLDISMDLVNPAWRDAARVRLVQGDATSAAALDLLPPGQTFDLIVDDASHSPEDQLATLDLFAPLLRAGGTYVIEDIDGTHAEFQRVRAGIADLATTHGLLLTWHDLRHIKGRYDDIVAELTRA